MDKESYASLQLHVGQRGSYTYRQKTKMNLLVLYLNLRNYYKFVTFNLELLLNYLLFHC